jgi:hypothetical protein
MGPTMVDNPLWEICERLANAKVALNDHTAAG